MLGPLNRDCLSFCVTVFTFRGYRSFRLCRTMSARGGLVVVVIWWLKIICDKNCGSVTQNCILIEKSTYVLFNFIFFIFSLLIYFQFHCNLQLIYTLGVYFCSVVLVVTKHTFLSSARVHFFHDTDPEALRMRAWCKFHFFQKGFSIFGFLFHVGFLGGPM